MIELLALSVAGPACCCKAAPGTDNCFDLLLAYLEIVQGNCFACYTGGSLLL